MKEELGNHTFQKKLQASYQISQTSLPCRLRYEKKGITNTSEEFKNRGIEVEDFLEKTDHEIGVTISKNLLQMMLCLI